MQHTSRLTQILPTAILIRTCITHTESVLATSMVIHLHHTTIQLDYMELMQMDPTALQ
jgi:hypothetical protein